MLINVHKPKGITSHDVVDEVRKSAGWRTGEKRAKTLKRSPGTKTLNRSPKVGHAGTLDPFATGVLVVGVGRESTKKLGNISKNTDKEYIAVLELGKTSSTHDPEGEIIDTDKCGLKQIDANLIKHLGWQSPYLTIRVICSSGTYIRALARDIGEALGTGAYLTELTRTRVGDYKIEDSQTLEELKESQHSQIDS